MDRSDLIRLTKKGCDIDLQIHIGDCTNPRDYVDGWEKVIILENAVPTTYGTDEFGAMEPGDQGPVTETVPFEGEEFYEVTRLSFQAQGAAQVAREVVGIYVCDSIQCGACGVTSDGCQVVLATTVGGGGSPGLLSEVVYTKDGGSSWSDVDITGMPGNEQPTAIACVGSNVIVITADGLSLWWADLSDLVTDESHSWAEVTSGFVSGGGPRAIYSNDPTHTWIVGNGGYIYFTDDPTSAVEVQDAGSAAGAQDLLAVHALNEQVVVAVGNSNTVLVTRTGGETWESVTGPAVGVNLTAVWVRSAREWIVGTAGGALYYTRDEGSSWSAKSFTGTGTGVIRDIKFATKSVGYMAHDVGGSGYLHRTINGGFSWQRLPEGTRSMPTNDRINTIALCGDPNIVYAGGLGADGSDGIILKGA
jgi:photosystem II stability/assembly factor-like uncharacterized protein